MEIASTRPITPALFSPSTSKPAASSGSRTWARVQKASAVFADGKIYIGSRERQVLHPAAACRPLRGPERGRTAPQRERALSRRRFPSRWWPRRQWRAGACTSFRATHLYAIGPKKTAGHPWKPVVQTMEPGQGDPAWVQVEPTELVLKPGQTIELHARLYDAAGPFSARRQVSRMVARSSEGNGDRWQVRSGRGSGRAGGIDQGHRRQPHRRSARARDPAAAVERDVRFLRGGHAAAAMGERAGRPVSGGGTGWPEGARKATHRNAVQAHARLHGAVRLVELYCRGRHPHSRKAPPDGRCGHHRAALHAVRLRQ